MFRSVIKRSYSTNTNTIQNVMETCLKQVPNHGFEHGLTVGLRECGYSDASHAALTSYDLVNYHLKKQRKSLKDVEIEEEAKNEFQKLDQLLIHRLKQNESIQSQLSEALAIMTKPTNLSSSLQELHKLSDELWWLSGDRTSDFSWYTKRASLSSLYAASEMFMVQDKSSGYRETIEFAKHRLHGIEKMGYASSSSMEWVKFNTIASFNVLKSLTRM